MKKPLSGLFYFAFGFLGAFGLAGALIAATGFLAGARGFLAGLATGVGASATGADGV